MQSNTLQPEKGSQQYSEEVLFTKPLRSGRIWHKVNF